MFIKKKAVDTTYRIIYGLVSGSCADVVTLEEFDGFRVVCITFDPAVESQFCETLYNGFFVLFVFIEDEIIVSGVNVGEITSTFLFKVFLRIADNCDGE